jgi:hypothetical protein
MIYFVFMIYFKKYDGKLVESEIYFLRERLELDHMEISLSTILSFHSIVNIRDYYVRK